MKIETLILRNLMLNEDYTRNVIPHLKTVYFEEPYRAVFNEIVSFVNKFNALPSADALSIELRNNSRISEDSLALIPEITKPDTEQTEEWLIEKTEKWCQDRAIYLAIMDSINIIEGKHETLDKNALPQVLAEALGVNFDLRVGHDYIDDSDARYEFYHRAEEHIPFDLEKFNTITKGGLVKKSLNVALAGTGVGKSLFMCHVAAGALTQMKNVLYITMEMAEERVAERIDANLMNVPLDQLENLSKDMFDKKMHKLVDKGVGKLIVKEYPTGAASSVHFRSLLKELKIKRDFTPDIICIDYLNICASSRMKSMGGAINSYIMVKAIAEELRGLAVEYNLPIVTATQTTRSGFASSDVGLEDTAESFGLPATADLMFALISTEELENLNQIMVKQLKNRYNDPTGKNKKFVLGIDRAKMRLYDVEDTAQTLNVRDEPPKKQTQFEGFNYE
jgi:archaellum biogenesis ATPase FlaH